VDIPVNNAGGPPPGDFRDWDREAWLKAIDANMLTPIELIKATVDGMAERGFGRIVNITSAAVKAPIDILGLSNGARSGLTGFVAGLARQPRIASRNVTINALLPGPFDTDRLRGTMAGAAAKAGKPIGAVMDERRALNPSRRFGTPAALCSRFQAFASSGVAKMEHIGRSQSMHAAAGTEGASSPARTAAESRCPCVGAGQTTGSPSRRATTKRRSREVGAPKSQAVSSRHSTP
jgi:NAD(P)-dependent dehydrogenase (short-subunit alcohol dehydrogenase family)